VSCWVHCRGGLYGYCFAQLLKRKICLGSTASCMSRSGLPRMSLSDGQEASRRGQRVLLVLLTKVTDTKRCVDDYGDGTVEIDDAGPHWQIGELAGLRRQRRCV
jgi:hypothetical protein